MSAMKAIQENTELQFGEKEINQIESFRLSRETAVLTIMFTDIKGFTELTDRKGEAYSNKVRQLHDEVLEGIITENKAGIIVKHIGDAVMAVFSEPSTAVQKAILIQKGISSLHTQHPNIEPIEVRIGLDMGQVTVEEKISMDIFGGHVNRASRIEGLADGGQVYMSHAVYDSVRGWLNDPTNQNWSWKSHGRYQLKGVSSPTEVFEIVEGSPAMLRPPRKGNRVRSVPSAMWSGMFILIGISLVFAFLQFKRTEVWFVRYLPQKSILDGQTEILLEDNDGSDNQKVLVDVGRGKHILHYDVADGVRYYSEIEVERGENHIKPKFLESRLPAVSRYIKLGDENIEATREGNYFFYNAQNEKIEHHGKLTIRMQARPAAGADQVAYRLGWKIALDGNIIADSSFSFTHPITSTERIRKEIAAFSDTYHYYFVRYRFYKESAYLEIVAEFKTLPALDDSAVSRRGSLSN